MSEHLNTLMTLGKCSQAGYWCAFTCAYAFELSAPLKKSGQGCFRSRGHGADDVLAFHSIPFRDEGGDRFDGECWWRRLSGRDNKTSVVVRFISPTLCFNSKKPTVVRYTTHTRSATMLSAFSRSSLRAARPMASPLRQSAVLSRSMNSKVSGPVIGIDLGKHVALEL